MNCRLDLNGTAGFFIALQGCQKPNPSWQKYRHHILRSPPLRRRSYIAGFFGRPSPFPARAVRRGCRISHAANGVDQTAICVGELLILPRSHYLYLVDRPRSGPCDTVWASAKRGLEFTCTATIDVKKEWPPRGAPRRDDRTRKQQIPIAPFIGNTDAAAGRPQQNPLGCGARCTCSRTAKTTISACHGTTQPSRHRALCLEWLHTDA